MSRIERLPESIYSSVRSGVVICDLSRVVEELVFNSLDAGATKVSVAVGVCCFYVKVVDNGSGLTRDGLMLVGERYATSKVDHLNMMGSGIEILDFHGESLHAISNISLLEIVTKARGKPNGYRKMIKNCKCLFLGISDDRQDVGTTVTARDIFYNQPVRRKQIESSPNKVLDSIKMSVLRIALVHENVSFKVVDVESTDELLHTGPSHSPFSILFRNFGIKNSNGLFALNVSDGPLKISGYISGPCGIFSLKKIQYVYINSRFICKGPIHKLLDQLAANFELLTSSMSTTGCQSDKRNRCYMGPTFILNVNCPRSYYDIISSERSQTSVEFKDWSPILTTIEKSITRLWKENISDEKDATIFFESGRKKCKKQKSETYFDLCSPKLEVSEDYDNILAWKGPESSNKKPSAKLSHCKRHQGETDLFSNKQEDGLLSREPEDFLPKFNDNMNSSLSHDMHINTDAKESFLRSCSFQESLRHDRVLPLTDERFEFRSDDLKMKTMFDFDENLVDEIDMDFYGSGTRCNGPRLPFQTFPMTHYDTHERSEFLIRDSVKSHLVFSDILPDDSEKCWSPIVESRSEYDKDSIHYYSAHKEDGDLMAENLNMKENSQQQDYSFMSSSPQEIGKFHRENFDTCFSPYPFEGFRETDRLPLPSRVEESPERFRAPSFNDTRFAELEYRKPNNKNQKAMPNRKTSSIRSLSAPPFHKGRKRFLDLSDSSTNFKNIGTSILLEDFSDSNRAKVDAKSVNYMSPIARSAWDFSLAEGVKLDKTPEVIKTQNCRPPDKEQFVNTESDKCLDLKEIQDSFDSRQKWRKNCVPAAGEKTWMNTSNQDSVLDIFSDIFQLTGDSIVPNSIAKTCLEYAKVLNQVDKKFIAIVAGTNLAMIDQHAADERIRLEELRLKVLSGEMKKIKYLDDEQQLVLPEIGSQLLHNYSDQVQSWGWICNIHSQNESFFTKDLDFLHRQPPVIKLLAVPCILGVNLTDIDLLEFLQQLSDTDGSSTIPPSVHRILNNKACRGAIMFGDTLLPSECSLIVEELKRTSLCFQCAHGRPTTVPIVNLEVLHEKISKLGSHDESWHGLHKHEFKFKRSAQRLRSALS